METRKIQQVTGGTPTVSLPRDWAEAENIDQGDVVDLHTHIDGILVVQPRDCATDPTGDVTVEIRNSDTGHVLRSLRAAYTAGYTEITLTTRDAFTGPQRRVANEVSTVLAGATVTSATDREIVVEILLDPEEISVRQLVRQLSFVAVSMHQTAMAAVAGDRPEPELGDRDDQADRLCALTERSFARALSRLGEVDSLGLTRPELFELWSAARDLERVADHAERIGTIAREFDRPPGGDRLSDVRYLSEVARDVVDYAVSGTVDDGLTDTLCEALELRTHLREEIAELDRRLFGDATADYRLARVLDSVQRTAEHGGNIAERGLRRTIRRGNGISLGRSGTTVERSGEATREPPVDPD